AERYWRRAIALLEPLVRRHPEVVEHQQHLAVVIGNLGWSRSEQGDWPAARSHFEEAVVQLREAFKSNPKNPDGRLALRNQLQSLAEASLRLGDHTAAAQAAVELSSVFGDRGQDYYYAACFLARCMPLAAHDKTFDNAEARQAVQRKYL